MEVHMLIIGDVDVTNPIYIPGNSKESKPKEVSKGEPETKSQELDPESLDLSQFDK